MNTKEFSNLTRQFERELETFARRTAPVIVGRLAENHFRNNFRKGGFVDRELKPWPRTRRQQSGAGTAASKYGPLLSSREHLMSSTQHMVSDFRVRVFNDVPYAPIHNWGGTTHPTVTPQMRRYAWSRYYAAGGGKKNKKGVAAGEEAERWKRLALTKKTKLTVRIPQRQFLGPSAELDETIRKELENELTQIFAK